MCKKVKPGKMMMFLSLESDEELEIFYESLSTKINYILKSVSDQLRGSLTWEIFIDVERNEKFNSIFAKYLRSIDQLEDIVSRYVQVTWSHTLVGLATKAL